MDISLNVSVGQTERNGTSTVSNRLCTHSISIFIFIMKINVFKKKMYLC